MSTDTAKEEHLTLCTNDLNNLHITQVDICACCGKEGSDLNICNKCQMVKYCNVACKKKHRTKHKKKCERRVAELHDERLFKQPPPREDCPICMLPFPSLVTGSKYYTCCGKFLCGGCIFAPVYDNRGNIIGKGRDTCPFCRTPAPCSDQEMIERIKKRIDAGDAEAIFSLGCCYSKGSRGLQQNHAKALELNHRAGELGCTASYNNIGDAYHYGRGVESDEKKADHYYGLSAMGGDAAARHNLGCSEYEKSNWGRAIKHYMISAGGGYNDSVKSIQLLYKAGHATKDDYTKALRAYQKYLDEIRSEQRDKAAAANERFKYY